MRGSGFAVPSGLANAFDVRHGDVRRFSSEYGPQEIRWKTNTINTGSIKRILDEMDVVAGDTVFLHFRDNLEFEVRKAAPRPKSTGPDVSVREALRLVGAPDPSAVEDPVDYLRRAINAPEGTKGYPLQSLYMARGDMDIVTLLGAYWPTQR